MTDFYLHKYTTVESICSGIVAPHKYRLKLIKNGGYKNKVLEAWKKDKQKILNRFIIEMENYYQKDEIFLLFVPPTNTEIFTKDSVEKIKVAFPNVIDVTKCFKKNSIVSFGNSEFNFSKIPNLLKCIEVNKNKLTMENQKISKAFIADDVHSSGKTMKLTKYLIKEFFRAVIEIKSGVILRTI